MLKNRFTNWVGLLAVTGAPMLAAACVSGAAGGEPPSRPMGAAGSEASPGAGGGGGGSSGAVGSVAPPAPTSLPEEKKCETPDAPSPGPRLLRRLTAREFAASIADLFGDHSAPVAQVFNDSRVLGFSVDSSTLMVQDLNADQLMNNAEAVASWAVSSKLSQLTQLAPQLGQCSSQGKNSTSAADWSTCANLFVKNFGRKAFRTAIPDGDSRIKAYSDLFMAEANFADGASAVIAAMLQSPYFLYRSEIGPRDATGATINLTPYEVASSLSYLLTGSTPDDTLLKAADTVGNDSAALRKMVDDQAARLLGPAGSDPLSPAAQDALMNFMSGWLGLDRLYTNVKDDNVQKLTDDQRADMANETKQFILSIWGGSTNNTVSDLFSANYTFLNQNLANYYKLTNTNTSSSFSKVPLPSGRDGGILAQASILIGYARSDLSSPTQRGHLVRSRLLCQDVPPPPAGLDTKFTPSPNLKTTREKYLQGHAAPGHEPCYTCHTLMDPIGVAFEHYDSFGNYQTMDNGEPVDATGVIHGSPDGGDVNVDGLSGPKGLETYLAKSDAVKTCLVRYWSYYAFGTASWAQDGCTYDAIRNAAASDSYSLKSVLTAILHTPRFTTRVNDK